MTTKYLLIKEKGHNQVLTLLNTETSATMVLGRVSIPILDILNKHEDITIDKTAYTDVWKFAIKDETARELAKITMKVHRAVEKDNKPKQKVDAMDVLLGIANYSKIEGGE